MSRHDEDRLSTYTLASRWDDRRIGIRYELERKKGDGQSKEDRKVVRSKTPVDNYLELETKGKLQVEDAEYGMKEAEEIGVDMRFELDCPKI